jgi:hypothetical protein
MNVHEIRDQDMQHMTSQKNNVNMLIMFFYSQLFIP